MIKHITILASVSAVLWIAFFEITKVDHVAFEKQVSELDVRVERVENLVSRLDANTQSLQNTVEDLARVVESLEKGVYNGKAD